jgi:hypothetical protein
MGLISQYGNYPDSYREFVRMFPDDTACEAFLFKLRWPDGFVCRSCKTATTPWDQSRGRLVCLICRYQTSVTTSPLTESDIIGGHNWDLEVDVD